MPKPGDLVEFSTWLEPGPGRVEDMNGPYIGVVERTNRDLEVWVRCTDPDFVQKVRYFMITDGGGGDRIDVSSLTLAILAGDDLETIKVLPVDPPLRRLIVQKGFRDTGETVARYLPHNYWVVSEGEELVVVEGYDSLGWTLEDYVIPRLLSGNIASHIE